MENVRREYLKHIYLDVVRFSKKSAEAQSATVHKLNEIVEGILRARDLFDVDKTIILPTGDGMCISILQAASEFDLHLNIAIEILERISRHNESADVDRIFDVRIGINQNTDIIVIDINQRENVAGAGINMAARTMDVADGGMIMVSSTVHSELTPSEIYRDSFRRYPATGKHGIKFDVFQYVKENQIGLNVSEPSALSSKPTTEPKITAKVAYYMANALVYKDEIVEFRRRNPNYVDTFTVLFLALVAEWEHSKRNSSQYEAEPECKVWRLDDSTFPEKYEHYSSLGYEVVKAATAYIIEGRNLHHLGFLLSDFSELFERSVWGVDYDLVNDKGKRRLIEEHPEIAQEFGIE